MPGQAGASGMGDTLVSLGGALWGHQGQQELWAEFKALTWSGAEPRPARGAGWRWWRT